jgi:hypothetical protein
LLFSPKEKQKQKTYLNGFVSIIVCFSSDCAEILAPFFFLLGEGLDAEPLKAQMG